MERLRKVITGMIICSFVVMGVACGGGSSSPVPGVDLPEVDLPGDGAELPDDVDEDVVSEDMDGDGVPDDEDADADGDGFLGTEDDCNDLNPAIHPDAEDLPDHPGYTDSNCDGSDGDSDWAFWVAPDGNDANPGTIDQPFLTVQHGVDQAIADLGDVRDVYVVGGVYNEDVAMSQGVGVYGGYGVLDGDGHRSRDIAANDTEVNCATTSFFIAATSTGRESVLEGVEIFSIPNLTALIVINSSPLIRYSRIRGIDGGAASLGMYALAFGVDTVSEPTISNSVVESMDCGLADCESIAFLGASAGNNARVDPTLDHNTISSGDATHSSIGVMMLSTEFAEAHLTARYNDISAGTGMTMSAGMLFGYNIFDDTPEHFATAEITKNTIYGGVNSGMAHGVVLWGAQGVEIANNFITGGHSSMAGSFGIGIRESTATVRNNTINGGSSAMMSIPIMLQVNAAAKIRNNILFAEDAPFTAGVAEFAPLSDPLVLVGNLFEETLSVYYHDNVLGGLADIALVNGLADIPEVSDNIAGLAQFTDVASLDYHLLSDSGAIDSGIADDEVATDIDDDERPFGEEIDIGADEFIVE